MNACGEPGSRLSRIITPAFVHAFAYCTPATRATISPSPDSGCQHELKRVGGVPDVGAGAHDAHLSSGRRPRSRDSHVADVRARPDRRRDEGDARKYCRSGRALVMAREREPGQDVGRHGDGVCADEAPRAPVDGRIGLEPVAPPRQPQPSRRLAGAAIRVRRRTVLHGAALEGEPFPARDEHEGVRRAGAVSPADHHARLRPAVHGLERIHARDHVAVSAEGARYETKVVGRVPHVVSGGADRERAVVLDRSAVDRGADRRLVPANRQPGHRRVEALQRRDVLRVDAGHDSAIHRIHDRRGIARMRQPEAVARLVERDAEDVVARGIAGPPVERVVEMDVAGNRLRRGRRRVKSMSQDFGGEREPVAVVGRPPQDRQRPRLPRRSGPLPLHVHVVRPLAHRPRNLSELERYAEIGGAGREKVGEIGRAVAGSIPAVPDGGVVGDDPLRADEPFADQGSARQRVGRRRIHPRDAVIGGQALDRDPIGRNQRHVRGQTRGRPR